MAQNKSSFALMRTEQQLEHLILIYACMTISMTTHKNFFYINPIPNILRNCQQQLLIETKKKSHDDGIAHENENERIKGRRNLNFKSFNS